MNRLITIPFSHYNEKARWALDRHGVPFREEPYMPVFHFAPVMLNSLRHGMGRADKVSSPFSTPVLVTDGGECLQDSSDIVRWASDRYAGGALYPTPEVAELEKRFHDGLGAHSRRVAYFYAFSDPTLLDRMAEENVGAAQARWFKRFYPLVKRVLVERLMIDRDTVEKSRARVDRIFDETGELLRGRRYLVGDHFTAADLAFCCMAAPAILPTRAEGYGAWLPPVEAIPDEIRTTIERLRASDTGAYVLRMFASERRVNGHNPA